MFLDAGEDVKHSGLAGFGRCSFLAEIGLGQFPPPEVAETYFSLLLWQKKSVSWSLLSKPNKTFIANYSITIMGHSTVNWTPDAKYRNV